MSTTASPASTPGLISPFGPLWNRTSFTNSSPCFGVEYSTSPQARPAGCGDRPASPPAPRAYQLCDGATHQIARLRSVRYRSAERDKKPYPGNTKVEDMAVIKVTD